MPRRVRESTSQPITVKSDLLGLLGYRPPAACRAVVMTVCSCVPIVAALVRTLEYMMRLEKNLPTIVPAHTLLDPSDEFPDRRLLLTSLIAAAGLCPDEQLLNRVRRVLMGHFNASWRQGQLPSGQTAKARADYRVQSLHLGTWPP